MEGFPQDKQWLRAPWTCNNITAIILWTANYWKKAILTLPEGKETHITTENVPVLYYLLLCHFYNSIFSGFLLWSKDKHIGMAEIATLAWPQGRTECEWWSIFVWWPCDELRTCSGCNLPLTWRQLDIQHLLQHWWLTAKEGTCPAPTGGSVLICRFTNTVAFRPNKSVFSYIV